MLIRFLAFLAVFLAIASTVPVEAKETFKDEAGRLIYIIGDDGIVTMYENSSTDTTLSIKRGLREQMNPSLSEVIPDTVAAGSSITLKLRGKNLVGASPGGKSAGTSTGRGFGLTSVLLGQADCATERLHQPWKSEAIPGRCCK